MCKTDNRTLSCVKVVIVLVFTRISIFPVIIQKLIIANKTWSIVLISLSSCISEANRHLTVSFLGLYWLIMNDKRSLAFGRYGWIFFKVWWIKKLMLSLYVLISESFATTQPLYTSILFSRWAECPHWRWRGRSKWRQQPIRIHRRHWCECWWKSSGQST